jgi:hypothetical protein
MKKIYFLILLSVLSLSNFAQKVILSSKMMEITDMTKLIQMDIDDATEYLGNFNYTLTTNKKNNDNESYLLFNFDIGEYHTQIKLFYLNNKVFSLYYNVANKELRKFVR